MVKHTTPRRPLRTRLRQVLQEHGCGDTQPELLCVEAEVSLGSFYKWERGHSLPGSPQIFRLVHALRSITGERDITVESLYVFEDAA